MARMLYGYRDDYKRDFQIWQNDAGEYIAYVVNGKNVNQVSLPGSVVRLMNAQISEHMQNIALGPVEAGKRRRKVKS